MKRGNPPRPLDHGHAAVLLAPAVRVIVAPKRNGHTNGRGAVLGPKVPVDTAPIDSARIATGLRAMQRLIDPALFADPYAAANFIGNVLEASTETSIIGTDLEGNIQLWNEGARRLYGYEPEEVIGKANPTLLHT